MLSEFIENLEAVFVNTNNISPLKITNKEFQISSKKQNIFIACKKVLESIYEYETDGVIFTPQNLGVGLNTNSDKVKDYKVNWKYSLKWKDDI